MKIALAGNKGSFSHQAAMMYVAGNNLSDVEYVFALDSAGVLKALTDKETDFGVMPIYNNTGGLVKMTLDAMGSHQFEIEATFDIPVIQCLLALPQMRQDEITAVVSHPQALAQCQKFLNIQMSDCQLIEYSDTAQAAEDLANGKIASNSAVLAPKLCAQLYGLRVVAEGVQDDEHNQTHFIIVKPKHLPPAPSYAGEGSKS